MLGQREETGGFLGKGARVLFAALLYRESTKESVGEHETHRHGVQFP